MMPFALSDTQLQLVMRACAPLDPAQRATLMERIAATLRLKGARYLSDGDVEAAVRAALATLLHESAA
jgi:hypothetical protein